MRGIRLFLILFAAGILPLHAHFQMIYTPSSNISGDAASVDFILAFTHPFESGHTMDIGKNESGEVKGLQEFFAVHKKKKTDLLTGLQPISFSSHEDSGRGFVCTLDKRNGFRGGGDWVLTAVPFPYYEPSEDKYIRQITKVMINKGQLDTDWSNRVAEGYPEIIPLVKPYDVWTGGVFRGTIVDREGHFVPHGEIEFVYMNYEVDTVSSTFTGSAKLQKSGTGMILADDRGVFEFIPPRAGYWGFSAGIPGGQPYEGKEVAESAVLWIEAQPYETETALISQTDNPITEMPAGSSRKPASVPALITALAILAAFIAVPALKKKI